MRLRFMGNSHQDAAKGIAAKCARYAEVFFYEKKNKKYRMKKIYIQHNLSYHKKVFMYMQSYKLDMQTLVYVCVLEKHSKGKDSSPSDFVLPY